MPFSPFAFRRKTQRRLNLLFSIVIVLGLLLSPVADVRRVGATAASEQVPENSGLLPMVDQSPDHSPLPTTPKVIPAAPVSDIQLPSLTIDAKIEPQTVTVGSDFTVTLTINNSSPYRARNMVVSMPLPDGASKAAATKSAELSWQQESLAGSSSATFTTSLHLDQNPSGHALLIKPQVIADGLEAPIWILTGRW